MKAIKFRAWDKKGKKMMRERSSHFLINFGGDLFTIDNVNGVTYHKNANLELMQFIGLIDRNGKDIYEGDIVEKDNKCFAKIVFYNGRFQGKFIGYFKDVDGKDVKVDDNEPLFCFDENGQRLEWFKVVGNIYENPELPPDSGGAG